MKQSMPARRTSGHSPTDQGLIGTPLDFISEDHLRERQICGLIEELASVTSFDRQAGLTILRFVNEELTVHLRDEAEDLFPLLARRCTAEDCIESTINRIRLDQDEAKRLLPRVREILSRCLDTGCDLFAEDRETLIQFAGHLRRHLVAENAILLPIARARLTRADLRTLSEHMRSRRGLPALAEIVDAD